MITTDDIIHRFFEWQPQAKIASILPLTPDSSMRRYFRISLSVQIKAIKSNTVVAMVFDSLTQPESGGPTVEPNVSCVQLGRLFTKMGYPVAEIYFGEEKDLIFFIEDIGTRHLIDLLIDQQRRLVKGDKRAILKYYKEGIECISRLHAIPEQKEFFPFQRCFTQSSYDGELNEVVEFYLRPFNNDGGLESALREGFSLIVSELMTFTLALAHRDYHSWNLMIDNNDRVRIIDYQDALLAPRTYDLVPLLNDRDTNLYLGDEIYYELFDYAFGLHNKSYEFVNEYTHVLLQRDLKIVGRFNKLAKVRGLNNYLKWVPGALFTIGRLLSFMIDEQGRKEYKDLLSILRRLSSETDEGSKKMLRLLR
ncbi:MAG: phosphotransferase [Deltaproteobacteria bacterium]|nr:phosphotransferase [Deltaproteobacteria bacterium]